MLPEIHLTDSFGQHAYNVLNHVKSRKDIANTIQSLKALQTYLYSRLCSRIVDTRTAKLCSCI